MSEEKESNDTVVSTRANAAATTNTAPTTVSTVALEGYLLQTLLDIQSRSQVEAKLEDLVTDVEFAVTLQDQLAAQTHQHQAEKIIATQAVALEETHVVQKDRLQAQTLLADALVTDLWGLSKEVGSLLELKQKHEAMLLEYDELMAKLVQAEEDLYVARSNPQPQAATSTDAATSTVAATVASEGAAPVVAQPAQAPKQAQPAQQQQQQSKPNAPKQSATHQEPAPVPVPTAAQPSATMVTLPDKPAPVATPASATMVTLPEKPAPSTTVVAATTTTTTNAADAATSTKTDKASASPQYLPAAALKSDPDEPTQVAAVDEPTGGNPFDIYPEEPPAKKAPVVALVVDDDEDGAANGGDHRRVTLETIDMEILMRIFGFLDAYDILNTAQVNISLYSRVDSLFGFGMDNSGQDDNVSTTSTLATTQTMAAATATTASVSTMATTKSAPPSSTVAKAAAAASKPTEQAANLNPIFGQRLVGGGRNIFNMLQGGAARATDAAGGVAAATAKRATSPKGRARGASDANGTNDGVGKPPLSEAMAHSMAAKLNDSEINAIISMTEKLRSKEKQVSLLVKEKQELEGKLNGSDAVKDFLITKVRDMEKIMNKSDETEKKVTQQIASDQEVIAFLDGRVQELERTTRVIQKDKNETQDKLKGVISQNSKKVAVLSDMLQFERQKLKENEREWKTTKKVLVKEVKGCRGQIVALQAERDGFREQNDALRKAVMANGSNNNGRPSSPHRY